MAIESGTATAAGAPRRRLTAPPLGATGVAVGSLLLLVLYSSLGLQPVWAALRAINLPILLVYIAIAVIVRAAYSLRWQLLARRLGPVPSFSKFAGARLAGDAVSALAPVGRVGGDPVRIGLLYGEGVGGTRAGAGVVIDRIVEIMGNSFAAIGYVTVCAVAYAGGPAAATAPALVGALVLPLVALLLLLAQWRHGMRPLTLVAGTLRLRRRRRWARWLVALRQTEDDLGRLCGAHPLLLLSGLTGSLFIEGVIVAEHYCLFRAFGVSLDLPSLLMVLLTTGLSRAAPVPAGLGAMEAGQVAVLTATGSSPQVGLVVATLLRLHECLWLGGGLVALWVQGVSLLRLRPLWWTRRAAT